MKDLSAILCKGLRCGVLVASLRITVLAQNIPSATVLSTNTPTLVLPGSLTLTSTVNQPVVPGGVPIGSVAFTADGTTPLGSAPLKLLPSTQSFPNAPTDSISYQGDTFFGLVAVDLRLFPKGRPVLVVGNNAGEPSCSGAATVSVFPNLGAGKFDGTGALLECLPSASPIDQIASGFFGDKTTKSALVHQQALYAPSSYSVIAGNGSGALTIATTPNVGLPSSADIETIAIDDFDGDGYSDVGVLIMADDVVGIAFNKGDGSGTFKGLVQATPPTAPTGESGVFIANAVSTGKFDSALTSELAVLGHFGEGANSYVVLYAAAADVLTQMGSPQPVGTNQDTLASADFNQDGKVDLLVGSSTSKQVQIFYGNGDGTFTPAAVANNTPAGPHLVNINDFNGDGYPDVVVTLDGNGASGFAVLLNDGTGTLKAATQPYPAGSPIALSSADFNSDGLPDLALLQQPTETTQGSIDTLLSSESAQASLVTPTHSLAAGTHILVAAYGGDTNFSSSASSSLTEVVNQTLPTITWATPAPTQLTTPPPTVSSVPSPSANVPGLFSYNPPLTTKLSLGSNILTTTFVPADTFDYSDATAQVTQQVDLPNASASVAILAAQLGADASQRSISLTLSPFPVDVQVTLTLGFTDASSNPADSNGSVKFVSVGPMDMLKTPTTDTFSVPANSIAVQPLRIISVGTVAGTIAATARLTLSDGTDVTPSSLAAATLPVAPAVPLIQKATYSITGDTLTVSTVASSTTREISAADFQFTPIEGKTLRTTDTTITNPPEFQQWFTGSDSATWGGGFTYTQSFTVSTDASVIGGVTVTLTNGQGQSAPSSAQSSD